MMSQLQECCKKTVANNDHSTKYSEVMVKPMNVPAWKEISYQISEFIADKLSDI